MAESKVELNLSGLLIACDGDVPAVRALVTQFLQSDAEDWSRLDQALQLGKQESIAQLAHRMGSAALYVNVDYATALYHLEHHARAVSVAADDELVSAARLLSMQLAVQCRAWIESC